MPATDFFPHYTWKFLQIDFVLLIQNLILVKNVAQSNGADDHGHIIPEGYSFISGHYLEKCGTVRKGLKFKVMAATKAYRYRESIVYLVVKLEKKDLLIIYNNDLCDVINYVEHGMANI